jgi:hypothetical protein
MSLLNPLTILFYTLAAAALGSLIVLARGATDRKSRAFGLAALGLIGSLDAMSLLGGFSIGPIMALVAVPLAVLLAWATGTFRMPLGLVALATGVLAVGLLWGDVYRTIQWTVGFGLAAVAVLSVMRLVRFWATREQGEFSGWCLALSAALGGVGLIFGVPDPTAVGLWAARLGALAAAGLVFFTPRFQLGLVAMALLDGLLALGLSGA